MISWSATKSADFRDLCRRHVHDFHDLCPRQSPRTFVICVGDTSTTFMICVGGLCRGHKSWSSRHSWFVSATLSGTCSGLCRKVGVMEFGLYATCQAPSTLITQPVSGVAGLSASSDISRGSVATHLKCGGICSDSFITNCRPYLSTFSLNTSVRDGRTNGRQTASARGQNEA